MANTIIQEVTSKVHELKTWPEYFQAVKYGFKNFEVRKNDRKFNNGDYVKLREWNPEEEKYTGEVLTKRIGYILQGGEFGVEKGFVVMQLIHDPFGPIGETKINR
jgi:hypothetical protein